MFKKQKVYIMIASVSQNKPTGCQRIKLGVQARYHNGVELDLIRFNKKYQKHQGKKIVEINPAKNYWKKKDQILEQLRNYFCQFCDQYYSFYSGAANQEGHWVLPTFLHKHGITIQFKEIIQIWYQNLMSSSKLNIFMDSPYSGNWCHLLKQLNQPGLNVGIYASTNEEQPALENGGGILFKCLFCADQQFDEFYKQILQYQTPIYINNRLEISQLSQKHLKRLQQNLQNGLITQYSLPPLPTQKYQRQYGDGIYEGQFRGIKRQGRGIMRFNNGDRYDGEWKDDTFHGRGILCFFDGEKYQGEWKEGQGDGKGVYYFPNGDKYECIWKKGQPYGRGTFTYVDSATYIILNSDYNYF